MFEIGEIVVGQNFTNSTNLNGVEMEVVAGLENRIITRMNGLPCASHESNGYGIRHPSGHTTYIEPYYLRKKKPPEASWEEIQSWAKWNPTKQGVEV